MIHAIAAIIFAIVFGGDTPLTSLHIYARSCVYLPICSKNHKPAIYPQPFSQPLLLNLRLSEVSFVIYHLVAEPASHTHASTHADTTCVRGKSPTLQYLGVGCSLHHSTFYRMRLLWNLFASFSASSSMQGDFLPPASITPTTILRCLQPRSMI